MAIRDHLPNETRNRTLRLVPVDSKVVNSRPHFFVPFPRGCDTILFYILSSIISLVPLNRFCTHRNMCLFAKRIQNVSFLFNEPIYKRMNRRCLPAFSHTDNGRTIKVSVRMSNFGFQNDTRRIRPALWQHKIPCLPRFIVPQRTC